MSLDVYLLDPKDGTCLYSANITHNLGPMAKHAEFYTALWRPDEFGITKASEVAEAIREGVGFLASHPKECKQFNSPNGWGTWEHFVPFCMKYLEACEKYPDAIVEVSR